MLGANNMKRNVVRALRQFNDKEENVLRNVNDVFECTDERLKVLVMKQAVELIEVKEQEVEKPVKEINEEVDEKPKYKRRKKNK